MSKAILYITYDGLTDALGQSQVLAYLTRLADENLKITILSYEKAENFAKEKENIESLIRGKNIEWVPLPYTKKPPLLSTYKDIRKGKTIATELYKKHRYSIVHCRSYVPAIIGLYLQRKYGVKFIFDMRGWLPDEKRESNWGSAVYTPVYHYFKKLEKDFFRKADFVVSLTEAGKEEIIRQKFAEPNKIGVIPTCVDFTIFKPFDAAVRTQMRKQLKIAENTTVLIYSGSLGGNYDIAIFLKIFKAFSQRFTDCHLLLLSKDQLSAEDQAALAVHKNITITHAPFRKVSDYLMTADAGLIIYKLAFSNIGRSPTKLGEYWASGLPVISIKGVGDLEAIYSRYDSGGVLLAPDLHDIESKMQQLRFVDKAQLRQSAKDFYDISRGVHFYNEIYNRLTEKTALL